MIRSFHNAFVVTFCKTMNVYNEELLAGASGETDVGVRYRWGRGNGKEEMFTGSQSHTETAASRQRLCADRRITFGRPGSYLAVKLQ